VVPISKALLKVVLIRYILPEDMFAQVDGTEEQPYNLHIVARIHSKNTHKLTTYNYNQAQVVARVIKTYTS
jgi:uncharacterized Zn finger protein